MSKKGKKKKASSAKIIPAPVQAEPPKKSLFSHISITWKIVGGLILVLGGILTILQIYDRCNLPKEKTQREKFDEKYIDSTLKPPKLSPSEGYTMLETPPIFTHYRRDDYPIITGIKLKGKNKLRAVALYTGNIITLVPISVLEAGIKFGVPEKKECTDSSYISFGVKDDRLYVSVEFKDLLKEETIGVIEYNHWRLYKENMFDFHNTDEKLEVIDRQNNIVFSIKFEIGMEDINSIFISGYFIGPQSVGILAYEGIQNYVGERRRKSLDIDTCISKSDKDWKQKASALISNIKTIFPKK